MKTGKKHVVILLIAVLFLAAVELAILFTYFLPVPFSVSPLRYPAEKVTEILIIRERREGMGTVSDCARVTEPAGINALCSAFRRVSLREELGHRWLDLTASKEGPYFVRVTMAGGIKVRFAFGGPGLFLLESSSPFSTEERESVYYRCDTDALCRLLDPYLEKYPELLTLEEAEDCRLSTYLMKEAEYEYGSFGYRQ